MSYEEFLRPMGRKEFTSYIDGLIRRMEAEEDCQEEGSLQLQALFRKTRAVASQSVAPIYKVVYVYDGFEFSPQYFASLNQAKREINRRKRVVRKLPIVALPCEIAETGLDAGVFPTKIKSVISNSDIKLATSGRHKFYEVRMLTQEGAKLLPFQIILQEVDVIPGDSSENLDEKDGVVFQFPTSNPETRRE